MATVGIYTFEAKLFFVAIKSTKRPPGAMHEMEKRLKLILKRVKVPKKLTSTLVPFVLKEISKRDI